MIYVACPYYDDDPYTRYDRVLAATRYTAKLFSDGRKAFSPLSHSVAIADEAPHVAEGLWLEFDLALLGHPGLFTELHVLMLPGWSKSKGVAEEMKLWQSMGNQVTFIEDWKELTK